MSEQTQEEFLQLIREVSDRIEKATDQSDNGVATVLALTSHLQRMMIAAVRADQLDFFDAVRAELEHFFADIQRTITFKRKQKESRTT